MADEKAEQLPDEVHEEAAPDAGAEDASDGALPPEDMSADELVAALEDARATAAAARDQALERFAAELLPVIDSLEKSVEAAVGDADMAAIAEGVALSLKLALGAMEKSGLEQIDPVGEPFDPELHEAMSMIESADAEPGSVVQVLQKGYTLNGRLVRAAMVLVAKEPGA